MLSGSKKTRPLSKNVKSLEIIFHNYKSFKFDTLHQLKLFYMDCEAQDSIAVYGYPTSKNFGSIDGLYIHDGTAYLFQNTVSTEHPVKNAPLKCVDNFLKNEKIVKKCVLIFVVPKKLYDSGWTKEQAIVKSIKGFVKIEQHVLCIDFADL
jgi:hypothetical protein